MNTSATPALLLTGLALLVAAPTASASTVSLEGGVLTVAAAPGEANDVKFTASSDTASDDLYVSDGGRATAGPGCRAPSVSYGSPVCPAMAVQRVVVRLGDGDDSFFLSDVPQLRVFGSGIPVEAYGEAGRDYVYTVGARAAGSVTDGGEGDDYVEGWVLVRGGPGPDNITSHGGVAEGGDGNDQIGKPTPSIGPAQIDAGPGDDTLSTKDGQADDLACGPGKDFIESADPIDRPAKDGSCESGVGVKPPVRPQVTVFEFPRNRARPGKDGRVAIWMACSVPQCAVTVQIIFAGNQPQRVYRFRPAPKRRLTLGTTPRLIRLPLTRAQRLALRRVVVGDEIGAVAIATAGGVSTQSKLAGGFCSREDPC